MLDYKSGRTLRGRKRGYLCVVIGGDDPAQRLVITAYSTKSVKRETDLWTK